MPYGITQCYLPPGSGDFPAFTEAGSQSIVHIHALSMNRRMEVWVATRCPDSVLIVNELGYEVRL